MFPSVKDRARQLFGEAAVPDTAPPPPIATGRRGAPLKGAAATKATPEPKTPSKTSRADARAKKDVSPVVEETPKAIGSWPSPFDTFKARTSPPEKITPPTPSKSSSSKTAAALKTAAQSKTSTPSASKSEKSSKTEKSEKSSKSEKTEKTDKSSKSEKKSSSRPKTPPTPKAAAPPKKAPEPKTSTPSRKKTESKPAPEPKKPSRPKLDTRTSSRPKMERSSSSSSLEDDEFSDLRAACLREASNITGLKGKNLAVSLRQRSSGGWYAALKDVGADKYLKMWMNRDKTFETQDEALEAYLVFVKKMNTDMKLFGPMSPKAGKSKGFF